jgi:hypothetical protein
VGSFQPLAHKRTEPGRALALAGFSVYFDRSA